MWLELDPLFANKTLLKIDLASSTEFLLFSHHDRKTLLGRVT